jgi:hypothetical protein
LIPGSLATWSTRQDLSLKKGPDLGRPGTAKVRVGVFAQLDYFLFGDYSPSGRMMRHETETVPLLAPSATLQLPEIGQLHSALSRHDGRNLK